MEKFYVISYDLGVGSIGWSVIDREGKVIKNKGKALWGVLIFDEAETAQRRRQFRSTRRRIERRKIRIQQLQMLMSPLVAPIDESFFRRLDMSGLMNQTRDSMSARDYYYNLFNGSYTDKKYYKDFPTIYHLRKALCENVDTQYDIRLVYLALHHLIKYRGNFLREEENIESGGEGIKSLLEKLFEDYADLFEKEIDSSLFVEVLLDNNASISDKSKRMSALLGKSVFSDMTVKLLNEKEISPVKIFKLQDVEEKKLKFGSADFEENLDFYSDKIEERYIDFILELHKIYSSKVFYGILGEGNRFVYQGMIQKYERHGEQLKALKELLRPYPELYAKTFKMPRGSFKKEVEEAYKKTASYPNYVRTNTQRTRYRRIKTTKEEFYDFLKKQILPNVAESDLKEKIVKEIESDNFLRRLNDTDNSTIPYQVNRDELRLILNNQAKFYPELSEVKDKIESILTFRRPYSVGVLKGEFSWINQRIDEKIYPWNFNDLVDIDKANEKFIEKLVGFDVYTGEKVLPLQSVTYQEYIVLNELNNLSFNGKKLDCTLKKKIFSELVMTRKSVSIGEMEKFIFNTTGEKGKISGFSDEKGKKLLGSMKTYLLFKEKLGNKFDLLPRNVLDEIAVVLTAFNDGKSKTRVLREKLKEYKINGNMIKALAGIALSGWGKYSAKLLLEMKSEEGVPRNIITLLKETNLNMNAILYSEVYGFAAKTVEKRKTVEKKNFENLVEPLYASPITKRTVWNAYRLTEEIIRIMGCLPENIFVETTREEDVKKKKDTRQDDLIKKYDAIKKEVKAFNDGRYSLLDETLQGKGLYEKIKTEDKLDSRKIYLYYSQCGRCMYTGEKIDINELDSYQIDHIVPRSLQRINGFDNLVLVKLEENQRKRDLAISDDVRERCLPLWKQLLRSNLITKTKFERLMKDKWTDGDIKHFVDRQLVETTQINKAAQEVLETAFPELRYRVKTIHAGLGTEFRKKHTRMDSEMFGNFYKLRDLNDYHHAKDAYIIGCLGLFTTEYCPSWGQEYDATILKNILRDKERNLSKEEVKKLVNDRYGIIIDALLAGVGESRDEEGEIFSSSVLYDNILKYMDKYNINLVKLKKPKANAQFYNQTIIPAGAGSEIPIRYVKNKLGEKVPLNPSFYGGYTNENQAYFVKIKYAEKEQEKYALVGIPALVAKKQEKDENATEKYLKEEYKVFSNLKVVGKPILKYQLIRYDGQEAYITAASEISNAKQMIVNKRYGKLLYLIEKKKIEDIAEKIKDFDEEAKNFVLEFSTKLKNLFPLYASIGEKISFFAEDGFDTLKTKEKCQYISCLLKITSGGRVGECDKNFKMGSDWGRLKGKKITPEVTVWIDQSITGFYVTERETF